MTVLLLILVFAVIWWWLRSIKIPQQNVAGSLGVLPERFIIFDLETTGLRADTHEIIEIGTIRVNRDSDHHETFQVLVKPSRKVPKRITDLTGISQGMLEAEGVPLKDALLEFRAFVGHLPMVAFNADFDSGFLKSACSSVSVDHFDNDLYCALKLARRAFPDLPSYMLSELSKLGNLTIANEHRALADCQRALIVYAASAQKLGFAGKPVSTLKPAKPPV